jgi:hypothetical protein
VNLASRIEAATKALGVACLVSEATQRSLPPEFSTQRLCRARLAGMADPVALYELLDSSRLPARQHRDLYAEALLQYEQDKPDVCLTLCRQRASAAPLERPWELLQEHAQTRLAQLQQGQCTIPFDGAYTFPTK